MSSLENAKPRPSLFVENGHGTALRRSASFLFHSEIAALITGASISVRFKTGDKAILMEASEFNIDQEKVKLEVYEGTTFIDSGIAIDQALVVTNLNRVSPRPTQIEFFSGINVDDPGIRIIHQSVVGIAGQNVNQPGLGSSSETSSMVLKPNTEHVFIITSESILPVNIESHFEYHEVNHKEYQ